MITYFKDLADAAFYTFFEQLTAQVNANKVAWNISAGKATELQAAFDAYKPLYNAIKIKMTRTPAQVEDHRTGRTEAEDFIEPFANEFIIPNSNISKSTKETLGFNVPSDERHERPVIEDTVFGKMDAQAGSRMEFICRTTSDASRPSMHPDADAVEVRYAIDQEPATVDEAMNKELSTKAHFFILLSAAFAGKKIYAYLRWRNNSNPEKSGPWGDVLQTIIRS